MIEKPLDRLNYYNGQRLEASDLKLEQEYHIRTRRWLNKSLYKSGIASGLDIREEDGTPNVIVSPGLALDAEGREILLLEEEHIFVPGKPHKNNPGSAAEVEGLYLTIRYNEQSIEEERNGCIPKGTNGRKNGDHPAWGGPALIRSKPLFNWRDALPYESSGEIVLGQVELDDKCQAVNQINTGVRRYVGAASAVKVHQYALEGEREVACIPLLDQSGKPQGNPIEVKARIYFHIRGRQANSVTLYLRASEFSILRYTEVGKHSHGFAASYQRKTDDPDAVFPAITVGTVGHTDGYHSHAPGALVVFDSIDNAPNRLGWHGARGFMLGGPVEKNSANQAELIPLQSNQTGFLSFDTQDVSATHIHTILKTADNSPFSGYTHKHQVDLSISGPTDSFGVAVNGRTGAPLTYVDDLRIEIDGKNVTTEIVDQLKAADPIWFKNSKDKLGDGSSSHPLADETRSSLPIKLDFLPGVFFESGEHSIEMSVREVRDSSGKPAPNGGCIHYNLYVE